MPAYNKKITELQEYQEFKAAIENLPGERKCFLSILFFAGCRVSEALALTPNDISYNKDMVYIRFFRLKGSKQTDPQELPRADALHWLCSLETFDPNERLFPWCRKTAYNIVKRVFPDRYPHYYRMNRITKSLERFSIAVVKNTYGLSLSALEHYVAKVNIKQVGKALKEELS